MYYFMSHFFHLALFNVSLFDVALFNDSLFSFCISCCLHYFIVALYQCRLCSYCIINVVLVAFWTIIVAPFNVLLYQYSTVLCCLIKAGLF